MAREHFVPITEARANFKELFDEVLPERDVVLVRRGRPAAIMIPIDRYDDLLEQISDLRGALATERSRHLADDELVSDEKVYAEAGLLVDPV